MPLTTITYGSLASSSVMNNNFNYLDNRISTVSDSLTSGNAAIYSSISSLSSSISEQTASIASDIEDLEDDLSELRDDFDGQNNAPDYSLGVGITMPYTVEADGYVYAGVNGIDNMRYVFVNDNPVHGHCGYSGGKGVYSGSLFRVSTGDVVTVEREKGLYYFYPMKGASSVSVEQS